MRFRETTAMGGGHTWQMLAGIAAATLLAASATHGFTQQVCASEGQFMMALSKQGFDSDRLYMVKGDEADRLVEETVAVAGDFVPPYDYVLVVERDDYTSVNPVRGGALCMHWRLTPPDWQSVKESVFGTIS